MSRGQALDVYISIRVPLAGHDSYCASLPEVAEISIRVPLAGHDNQGGQKNGKTQISIRVPLAGHDRRQRLIREVRPISIRVPLAGHDAINAALSVTSAYFNPRAPCGARLCR